VTFHSILCDKNEENIARETPEPPEFFADLNLGRIIDAITAGKQEYNLKPFFYTSLNNIDTIAYRHEIMRDLENPNLFEQIKAFAQKMRTMRQHCAMVEKLDYNYNKHHKEGWFLETVEIYCDAVISLAHDLSLAELKSRGFLAFRQYLTNYAGSGHFTSLLSETRRLKADLSTVKYCLIIKGNCVKVRRYESETDYSAAVVETFEKFRQGVEKDYRSDSSAGSGVNHIEAQILQLVARLYPGIFSNLADYYVRNSDFQNDIIVAFDREIQFYMAYLEYMAGFKAAGLRFCYPEVSDTSKEICDYEGFDAALANKLIGEKSPVVCNDFWLKDKERIFIVSGPNQGGKTTFARTFGQLHFLAGIGCPVPGREARLFLFDRLFTHFEKEEKVQNLRGKLKDDLVRIHDIVSRATSNSIIIMNEIFTSTALKDAVFLGQKILDKIIRLDALCVCVTFVDELASMSEKTVSVVSTIVPENPALRTYKLVRKPADGLAFAISIAEKHRLTYACLKERLRP